MKKGFMQSIAVLLAASSASLVGCEESHTHQFDREVATEQYLKEAATCENEAQYYYSCVCGEAGSETFADGKKLSHDYTAEVVAEEYLKKAATCQNGAEYYKSCTWCGKKSYSTFYAEGLGEHDYSQEKPDWQYLKTEATLETSAEFYKSCVCGQVGTETFFYGEPLRKYTDEEKLAYRPTSLTLTLYDAKESVYGFTYNTQNEPLRPVVQIQEGNLLTSECTEYPVTVSSYTSLNENDETITYYVGKAEVDLEPSRTYTYRVYDKVVQTGTEEVVFQTKNADTDTFRFAHVSESQVTSSDKSAFGTGTHFAQVLSKIVDKNDFIVHTGDVVQESKYKAYWTNMLDYNFQYLSRIPMMTISGNHETDSSYSSGLYEQFKYFNNKIPDQDTRWGYYYSFEYGNVKFIMLNTNLSSNGLGWTQYNWLLEELKSNTCDWTIVAMHNPMYSKGKWGVNPANNSLALALREQLKGIFARYGVDIVLQGHDHLVSRTYPIDEAGNATEETWQTENGIEYSVDPNGTIYVMNGPAGNQERYIDSAYPDKENELYKYAQKSNACSWAEFEIDGNTLTVTVQYTDGANVYEYQKWGVQKTL